MGFDWTAYAAPLGGPLAEAIRPGDPLPWADARFLLEQLVEEFREAEKDGSLPARLALDHIWVEPTGRVQVLDFPLCAARYRHQSPLAVLREATSLLIEGHPRTTSGSVSAPLPAHAMAVLNRLFATELPLAEFQKGLAETHAHRPEVTPTVRAAHLGIQAVLLALPLIVLFGLTFLAALDFAFQAHLRAEYAKRTVAALADPEQRAKIASSGDRARDKALKSALENPRVQVRINDLAARMQTEADLRRAQLVLPQRLMMEQIERTLPADLASGPNSLVEVREIVLWASAPNKSAAAKSDSPWGSNTASVYVTFLVIPLGLVLLAALFRGGVSMMLAGVAIVRADGRPALRSQCALRAAIVWLPVGALLFVSALLQIYAPQLAYLAAGLWLLAFVLLPLYAFIALRFPSRPPQDRLLGTYLMPV